MNIELIEIPKVEDYRGNIAIIEKNVLPFEMKRIYYLYDILSSTKPISKVHKRAKQFLVAISGSFDVFLNDGKEKKTFTLNKPNQGLLIANNIWSEISNFSSGAVCLVFVSEPFSEEENIYNFESFLEHLKITSNYSS